MNEIELSDDALLHARSAPPVVRSLFKRAVIVTAYITVFWLVLPSALMMLGVRFDRWLVVPAPGPVAQLAGLLIGAVGAVQVATAMFALVRLGRGLPISHLPPTRLVTSGIYGRARHPIYLAFTLLWIGFGLAMRSWGAALGGGAILTLGWIAYARVLEEPLLLERFGPAYRDHAARTRLLPIVPMRAQELLLRIWRSLVPGIERLANTTTLYHGRYFAFVTYGAFVGASAFMIGAWTCAGLIEGGIAPDRLLVPALCVTFAMLLGGRLLGLLYRLRLLTRDPIEALRTVGFVSYGGYAGLVLGVFVVADGLRVPAAALLDRLLLPGLLGSAIGRLGCLSYGCCGGRPWAYGIRWRDPRARIARELGEKAHVARIPTQLLSSVHALLLVALLLVLGTRSLPAGALSALGALFYGLGRILIEQTREEPRFFRVQCTRGQVAALVLTVLGLVALLSIDEHASFAPVVSAISLDALRAALPMATACGVVTLLITGVHGPRVGRW